MTEATAVRSCEWCSAPFQPKRRTSRTCSAPCRRRHNNAEQNAKRYVHLAARQCRGCAQTFQPTRSDSWACSNACWRRARYTPTAHAVTCLGCGQPFTAQRSDRRICSNRCGLRVYRAAKPGQHRLRVGRYEKRRATWLCDDIGISPADWRRQVNRQCGRCYYCDRRSDRMQMDHIVPLSRGGHHRIGNVVAACPSCNNHKGARLLSEWRYRHGARIRFTRR